MNTHHSEIMSTLNFSCLWRLRCLTVLPEACIHVPMHHIYTNNVTKNKIPMTSICKKLSHLFIIWCLKVGPTKSQTVARSRKFYIKRIPYKKSLVIKTRNISDWNLNSEKSNISGQSNSSYSPYVQTLGTHQTEILHVCFSITGISRH